MADSTTTTTINDNQHTVLLTGGCGFIGSHTFLELLKFSHYNIIIIDNFINSCIISFERVISIVCNNDEDIRNLILKRVKFIECDLNNVDKLDEVFNNNTINTVIHFASLKAVGESVSKPLLYYHNNLISTINLLETMKKYNVYNIVFSSSATVYGDPKSVPIVETDPVGQGISNPYGRTKAMIESIMTDLATSDNKWKVILLRYFNPCGAHPSGLIGEDPSGLPNNLFPYLTQTAVGKREILSIFGNDYPTVDGTGVRDYLHVVDLANGHVKAVELMTTQWQGTKVFNLGTGNGVSVLQLLTTFEKVNNVKIPYKFVERRAGDVATSYCDPTKAKNELGWIAVKTVEDMCKDGWTWQKKNPNGYSN